MPHVSLLRRGNHKSPTTTFVILSVAKDLLLLLFLLFLHSFLKGIRCYSRSAASADESLTFANTLLSLSKEPRAARLSPEETSVADPPRPTAKPSASNCHTPEAFFFESGIESSIESGYTQIPRTESP